MVGGSSVVAAVTRGDIDLHLRVRADAFAGAVDALRQVCAVVHPEIWAPTLATFTVPARLSAGLGVTPLGSEHDRRFARAWELLAADSGLLAETTASSSPPSGRTALPAGARAPRPAVTVGGAAPPRWGRARG